MLYAAVYGGGSGTVADPYQIWTPEQMNTIGANPADWDKQFKLMADIDMSAYTGTQYKTIGNSTTKFTGCFDGSGHVIRNLTYTAVSSTNYVGLFGYTSNAAIQNVALENILLIGNAYVGGIAGDAESTDVSNCRTDGQVRGGYVGGLIGAGSGAISNCSNKCSVYGTNGSFGVGGLVGRQSKNGLLTHCWNEGAVSGKQYGVGGLVGEQNGDIVQSYNCGRVINTSQYQGTGGIAGFQYQGVIKNCYNTGAIEGVSGVGGIAGIGGYVQNCYSIGTVSGIERVGGLTGRDIGVVNSIWDIETSQIAGVPGGYGRTSEQMKQAATYMTWNSEEPVWTLAEGQDYPHLAWEGQPGELLPSHSLSEYVTGSGTQWDPYRIYTAHELDAVGLFPGEWSKVFSLENNLDLGTIQRLHKIGNGGLPFSGRFEGNGHTISNFSYTVEQNEFGTGLFGWTQNAVIQNLRMENAAVSCVVSGGGSLAGAASGGCVVNCSASGSVSGGQYLGGLIGGTDAALTNCSSSCTVSGMIIVGGLVGNSGGTINQCYSTGTVVGTGQSSDTVGGLVARQFSGTIESCHSTADVSGTSKTGGLVGAQDQGDFWYGETTATISNCYSTGNVTGSDGSIYTGGLVGYQYIENGSGTISNCYSTGQVAVGTGSRNTGGLVGYGYNETVSNSFWDVQTSGQSASSKGTGKTTTEMLMMETFTAAGWDFSAIDGDPAKWQLSGNDYPRLAWDSRRFSGGSGTFEDPYQIRTAVEMNSIGLDPAVWDKHFVLMADIDMSAYTGTQYNIIGYYPWTSIFPAFTGSFNGNEHIIRNLNYSTTDDRLYVGLFGCTEDAVIKNLGLYNVSLSACGTVGGLTAYNRGSIDNCYVVASIHGGCAAGGLAGVNEGEISNCFAAGSVLASCSIGGIVGSNYCGLIKNSYAAASVNAIDSLFYSMGGFAGFSSGTLQNCFWDVEVSGSAEPTMDGVVGKTTAEMMMPSIFADAGWDFSDADGDAADWMMLREGEDYPRLAWQTIHAGDIAGLYGVDIADLMEVANYWLEPCLDDCEQADIDGNGAVNMEDFAVIAGGWLRF